jgi:hypothetical protein
VTTATEILPQSQWTLDADNFYGGSVNGTWTLDPSAPSYNMQFINDSGGGYGGHFLRSKSFGGFTPGQVVTVTVDAYSDTPFFSGGPFYLSSDAVATSSWPIPFPVGRHTASMDITVQAGGEITVHLGLQYVQYNWSPWGLRFFSITFTGGGVTPTEATVLFDTLMLACLNSTPGTDPNPGGGSTPFPTECTSDGRNVITIAGHQTSLYDNRSVPADTFIDAGTADWIGTDASESASEEIVQVRGGSGITWCGARLKSARAVSYDTYHGIDGLFFYNAQGITVRKASVIGLARPPHPRGVRALGDGARDPVCQVR